MHTLCENRLAIHCSDILILQQIRNVVFSTGEDGRLVPDFHLLKPMPEVVWDLPSTESGWKSLRLLKQDRNRKVSRSWHYIDFDVLDNYLFGIAFVNSAIQSDWTMGEMVDYLKVNPSVQQRLGLDFELGERYILAEQFCEDMPWTEWLKRYWGCAFRVASDNCGVLNTLENGFEIWFATECFPPDKWFEKLCETFPEVEFELQYLCRDQGFAGECRSRLDINGNAGMTQFHYDYEFLEECEIVLEVYRIADLLGVEQIS